VFCSPITSLRFVRALSVFSCVCFSLCMEDRVVGRLVGIGWRGWKGIVGLSGRVEGD
jgi:hypothetical protein